MDKLFKKVEELDTLLKQFQASIKMPKPPSIKPPKGVKMPGIAPGSKKDPTKVAQQLKNPRPKKPKMEMLKFDKCGQWSLHKKEEMEDGVLVEDTSLRNKEAKIKVMPPSHPVKK